MRGHHQVLIDAPPAGAEIIIREAASLLSRGDPPWRGVVEEHQDQPGRCYARVTDSGVTWLLGTSIYADVWDLAPIVSDDATSDTAAEDAR